MNRFLMMTPGPTYIREEVRNAMAQPMINPDLDPVFFEFYKTTCKLLQQLMKTQQEVLILAGEGILGLEAACASLIEPGDRVLCIDNGIFGKGFGDFAAMYGGEVTYFRGDYRRPIDREALEQFLQQNDSFKLATVVHCETPSGLTNPVEHICPLLKKHGILTVVDSVSAIGGEALETDQWDIDILLGGSQKCLSAPPGLTFMSISEAAWAAMEKRKSPIRGFYTNLTLWKNWYKEKWFPYTQPVSDLYALNKALELVLQEGSFVEKHQKTAEAVRASLLAAGLELYALEGRSNTVTAVVMPKEISFTALFDDMLQKHNILIAGAFDLLKDKVFRIGHMGENCKEEKLYITLKALNSVLKEAGVPLKGDLHKIFAEQ